ncbi:hypothetical protein [Streptomyces violascens]|uniref:hypothetical protein n=1 Tax=Streptomyces violascens TaxID=67381 RepID=UPI003693DECA
MSHALRAPGGIPPVHPANTTPVSELAEQLRQTGLVALDRLVTRGIVLAFAAGIMKVTAHRDSDPDGLTTIYDSRRHATRTGHAGLTTANSPHIPNAPVTPSSPARAPGVRESGCQRG